MVLLREAKYLESGSAGCNLCDVGVQSLEWADEYASFLCRLESPTDGSMAREEAARDGPCGYTGVCR